MVLRKFVNILLLAALSINIFYFWRSGLPQPSHFIMVFAILFYLLFNSFLVFESYWIWGVSFVYYTIIVNLIVFAKHTDISTLLASFYYLFNFIVFIFIINFSRKMGKSFFKVLFWIYLVQIMMITFLSLFSVGRYFSTNRYMGFFNDPNQMGNWVLWACIIVIVTGKVVYKKWWLQGIIALVLTTITIIFTASRSATVGLITLWFTFVFIGIVNYFHNSKKKLKLSIKQLLFLTLVICILTITLLSSFINSKENAFFDAIIMQAKYTVNRFNEKGLDDTFAGRGYDRICKYPEYLLFGAGEGAHYRFAEKSLFLGEIHSSWAGVLFYYGIIGSLLFYIFLFKIARKISWFSLLLLSPISYGFATYNIRNWNFWIGLALLYVCSQILMKEEAV
ncbi:MAG: hypothetical protein GX889_10315 [Clostridiales bacterium]|nr:hypothetical protein [Clostridiales bacterium]